MLPITRQLLGLIIVASLNGCSSFATQPNTGSTATDDGAQSPRAHSLPDTTSSAACPAIDPPTCPPPPAGQHNKPVIGEIERVEVSPPGITLNARIDTGATTTSINAVNIEPFERDGRKWVRFELLDDQQRSHALERRLERTVLIKRHGDESQQRFVVKLQLSLAGITRAVEVSLTDRSEFEYNLLIGRNLLRDTYAVDVSYRYHQSDESER
ncbi:ATP-dependent zinc protease family protein [Motiliproteus sediminis]|uniref:ATP-dependent zinc protease family protein n=1 Tax=Motiliproteus sediminis TaxID=1468178 RepID=UPI001AF0169A|nr:RimK/LysX family protein [Motiliproteus sediminis]